MDEGEGLVILDVSDPAAAVPELGWIDLGSVVNDVQVRDGYAYAATFVQPPTGGSRPATAYPL